MFVKCVFNRVVITTQLVSPTQIPAGYLLELITLGCPMDYRLIHILLDLLAIPTKGTYC